MAYSKNSFDFPVYSAKKSDAKGNFKNVFAANPDMFYQEPFRIFDRLYYIGSQMNGGFMLDSGEGLIIMDTGYSAAAPMLIDSIWRLGFDPKDIKMIFHTHKHSDHLGATKILKMLSGATTYMSEKDGQATIDRMKREGESVTLFAPDVFLRDGDEFSLGSITIKCYDTPGHSAGCMAFFFDLSCEDGKKYTAVLPGDLAVNTMHKNYITQVDPYPTAWEDFFTWTERMMDWKVDITLSCHAKAHAHMLEKYELMKANPGVNPFIDPSEWKQTLIDVREKLRKNILWEEEGKMWLDCSSKHQKLMVSEDIIDEVF